MTEQEVELEYKSFHGDVCIMFVTDDLLDLHVMYESAKKRLDRIYNYHYQRLALKDSECNDDADRRA